MPRRYSDLDDLIQDLDSHEQFSDDPFGIAEFDEDDLSILNSLGPDHRPRTVKPRAKKAPAKRGRPTQTKKDS